MPEIKHNSEVKNPDENRELQEQDWSSAKYSDLFSGIKSEITETLNKDQQEITGKNEISYTGREIQTSTPLKGNTTTAFQGGHVPPLGQCKRKCWKNDIPSVGLQ